MQNYHKHTSYSNIMTPDSAASYEDYAKRAVELGHKVISSVEHGWQGYYYQCYELAQKYGLKFIFGAEAYWVKDRKKEYEEIDSKTNKPKLNKDGTIKKNKDKTNGHIILLGVLLYVVPTERTEDTEAYGVKLLESTERIDTARHTTESTLHILPPTFRMNLNQM